MDYRFQALGILIFLELSSSSQLNQPTRSMQTLKITSIPLTSIQEALDM